MTARLLHRGVVALALSLTGGVAVQPAAQVNDSVATAKGSQYVPEVRLRKMHLVRPDLLPYPISFEIYC